MIDSGVFGHALRAVLPFAKRSTIVPVLECVYLQSNGPLADDGFLTLSATNLEQFISVKVAASLPGMDVCLPAKLLSEFVNTVDGGIDMAVTDNSVALLCGSHKARIKYIPGSEFPALARANGDAVSVDTGELLAAIRLGTYAAAKDESRPVLQGVLLTIDPLRMVTADGFRLAVAPPIESSQLPAQDGIRAVLNGDIPEPPSGVIVPVSALQAVSRVLSGPVSISIDDNRIEFASDTVIITSQLIDGRFPDYRAIIPTEHTTQFVVNRVALLDAVTVAMMFARDSNNIVRHTLKDGALVVSGAAVESGDGVTSIAVGKGDAEWAVNGIYLRQTLESFVCEDVTIELTNNVRPIAIRGDGLAVIMPMHITG